MRFLNEQECVEWSEGHGFKCQAGPSRPDLAPAGFQVHRFSIPSDAGKRVSDCRFLVQALDLVETDSLLWVTEWGVWSSGEHMPLFASLRRSFGEIRPLEKAPGQLFGAGQADDMSSFLCLACLFLWDVAVMPQGADRYLHLSHDEFGLVLAKPQLTGQIQERFNRYRLELRTE